MVQSTTYSLAQVILRLSEPAERVLVVSQSTARAASRLAESLAAQLNVPCEEIWQRQTVWDEHLFSDL